jgi:signal transduction histidine kinase
MDEDLEVWANAGALRQVLLNLLDNAVKFGPPGQEVTLRAESGDDTVTIAVEDEGPGVPPAQATAIWKPFVRLDAGGIASAGSGIGLAIVRDLVERQRGRAWYEPRAGTGSRFVFELPGPERLP